MAKPKGRSQAYKPRKVGTRDPRKRFLLICEGTKTEPAYFHGFRSNQTVIEVKGLAKDPKKLVNAAIERRDQAAQDPDQKFDETWCVFDRDDVPLEDFNTALHQAEANQIQVAYSNEAFELWYVLHFEFLNTGIPRKDYQIKVAKHLGLATYRKNDKSLYSKLLGYRETALKNAEKLWKTYQPSNPAADNPSTTVYKLVNALLNRAPDA